MRHRVSAATTGLLLTGALVVGVAVSGCTVPTAEDRNNAGGTTGTHQPGDGDSAATPSAGVPGGQHAATITDKQANALQRSWQQFVNRHPKADMSMALLPVGAQKGAAPLELGFAPRIAGGEALRVPIALAAVEKSGGDDDVGGDLVTALNANDARAAARLWASLGTPQQAAQATMRALRQGGDTTTRVQTQYPLRSEWLPVNQVRFAAGLACLPSAEYIRASMTASSPSQQFGFGGYSQAQFSNAWVETQGAQGPQGAQGKQGAQNTRGAQKQSTQKQSVTTVRQMVIMDMGKAGFAALSLTARTPDGTRAGAEKLLTAMAHWLMSQAANVPAGRCL